jgi:hypothetical protein
MIQSIFDRIGIQDLILEIESKIDNNHNLHIKHCDHTSIEPNQPEQWP